MNKLTLSAGLAGLASKADRSYTLRFDSLELSAEEISWLNGELKQWGWLCFSPNQEDPIEDADIPTDRAKGKDIKSHSERLRSVLYAYFKALQEKGDTSDTFSVFYERKMEQLISHFKEKLDK